MFLYPGVYKLNDLSGITAPQSNAHLAKDVGNAIIKKMEGNTAATYVFR